MLTLETITFLREELNDMRYYSKDHCKNCAKIYKAQAELEKEQEELLKV